MKPNLPSSTLQIWSRWSHTRDAAAGTTATVPSGFRSKLSDLRRAFWALPPLAPLLLRRPGIILLKLISHLSVKVLPMGPITPTSTACYESSASGSVASAPFGTTGLPNKHHGYAEYKHVSWRWCTTEMWALVVEILTDLPLLFCPIQL
jgi:hypothetical protein